MLPCLPTFESEAELADETEVTDEAELAQK